MKSIFNKLITKPAKDPIADYLIWLNDLGSLDEITALQTTTKHLTKFLEDDRFSVESRFNILMKIDEFNHPFIENIMLQYAKFENLRPELELRISETAYYYQRQLFLNYRKQIERSETQDTMQFAWNQREILFARAMQAAFAMIKLRYFRHQPVPDAAWTQIYSLYKLAEDENLLDKSIRLYEDTGSTSISTMLVQASMLDSLDHSNMKRQDINLICQLLRKLVPSINISKNYDEKSFLFYIDLSIDKGAKRVRNFTPTPNCRYWNMEGISLSIELLTNSTNIKQSLESLSLPDLYGAPSLMEVINHLYTEWSKSGYKRQRRKEERKSTLRTAAVTFGIETICSQMKFIANKKAMRNTQLDSVKTFEERLQSHSLSKNMPTTLMPYSVGGQWTITDESTKGYGAVVSKELSASIKPDMLIGLTLDEQRESVVIGVIKGIKMLSNGQTHVGVEVFSKQASLVQVTKTDNAEDNFVTKSERPTLNVNGFQGLYLAKEAGVTETPSVLLPRLRFVHHSFYEISNMTKKVVFKLGTPTEAKDDWAKVPLTSVK
ncbi:hypothetical protein [Methyloradius palustris]|uniref:Uncharacterized protein n=1 Tax=Methyloradius palustris TaxID=2778876 RepID=A0A8D5FZN6_9PROT|nr:hypothetical protein [Methyloradius palustris]BCM25234.1 hypothetical protein ZMTM_14930 [Methyloradius palustris]